MQYVVKSVCDRKTMRDFVRLPFEVYRNDPNWVPPLTSEVRRVLDPLRNPYFNNARLEMFVCYRERTPVSRVAIIQNDSHWQKYQSKTAFLGFFESLDDADAVRFLFIAVVRHCRTHGIDSLEGPFNPNHYSELGLQLDHFGESPTFFQPYNPGYYNRLFSESGFEIMKTIHTRRNAQVKRYVEEHFGNGESRASTNGYVVRPFRRKDFDAELERIREVFNDAFSDNWHFLPLTRDEYRFSAKFLNLVTYPELITIVERNGEPVGVLECVLDINPLLHDLHGSVGPVKYLRYQRRRRTIRKLIVYAVGIKKAYQRTRVHKLLVDALSSYARQFDELETTWMSEDNSLSTRAAERFGMEPDRTFAIYRKSLV